MFRRSAPFLLAFSLSFLFASVVEANDEDKAACADLAEGDPCTRSDGDAGVCVPDDDDPVLTCEDDLGAGSSSGSDSGSDDDNSIDCSVADVSEPTGGLLALAGLGLLVAVRRRR